MEGKISLIIADDEPYICEMLARLIDFDALGIELLACVNDGETLLNKVEETNPDIVLTDISMPKKDGLEVIAQSYERGIKCRFIIISGYRQFEYAYNALKHDVEDYILKPVDGNELNKVLMKVCKDIRNCEFIRQDMDSDQYKQLLSSALAGDFSGHTMIMPEVNRLHHVNFRNGLFRLLCFKIDFIRNNSHVVEDVSSLLYKIKNLILSTFERTCFEVATSYRKDGIELLINYGKDADREIRKQIQAVFISGQNIVGLFHGLSLTICAGRGVETLAMLPEAHHSVKRAEWIRLFHGLNQVIFEENYPETDLGMYAQELSVIEARMNRSITAIDFDELQLAVTKFFSLPVPVLCSMDAMLFVQKEIDFFCRIYSKVLKQPVIEKTTSDTIYTYLNQRTDAAGFMNEWNYQMQLYMEEMAAVTLDKDVKPVRQTYVYVEQHYAEQISLETMARFVNLNPVYFSNLFRKESGRTFTEYLTDFRMDKAKELLRGSDMNVNEIAVAIGYSDARYFSKVFKKKIGIKPTDYRKIYG